LEQFTRACSLSPARAEFLIAEGICLLHLKQPEEALAAFRKALDKSPDLEAALLGQAAALHMSYELDDAERVYRSVLARNSESRAALTNLVILGQQKKDDALVREHARKLLALDPDSEPALLALSNVSFTAGAFEAAAVHCARLVQLRPDQHDYWYNLGVAEERRGNLDASARAFDNAASAEPSSAAAYLACAAVFEKMGDNAAARVSLERTLRLAPQRIEVRYHIALLAGRQGLTQEAFAFYESIVAEDPKHSGSRFRLGFLKLSREDYQGASQDFEACLVERPQWREAEINLAMAYSKLNRADEAQAVLDKLLAREPRSVDALRGAAALSVEGAPALDNLLKLRDAGDRSPEVLFNSGLLHQQAGQWHEAIACYREALAANPKFADALVNLGHALMATGDPEGASESWAAAVELNPQLARGYY
jgi:tetratricopeptide (TPR) repeat protein